MLDHLQEKFPDVDLSRYLGFYSLQTMGVLAGNLVCEQVYVHSKMMIVDDEKVCPSFYSALPKVTLVA